MKSDSGEWDLSSALNLLDKPIGEAILKRSKTFNESRFLLEEPQPVNGHPGVAIMDMVAVVNFMTREIGTRGFEDATITVCLIIEKGTNIIRIQNYFQVVRRDIIRIKDLNLQVSFENEDLSDVPLFEILDINIEDGVTVGPISKEA